MRDLPHSLFIQVLGCRVNLNCQTPRVFELFRQNYSHMEGENSGVPDINYLIHSTKSGYTVQREDCNPLSAMDDGELLYIVEKDLTIELQKLRRDLYFLHAAALAIAQNAFLLVAPSGGGKSITTWALLHHGLSYLSDELSPVDLTRIEVHSYPHAICLKREPPRAYPVPANTVRTSRTLHIPTRELPVRSEPAILSCIFFLDFCPKAKRPLARQLSSAEAAAHLYAQALNPLAHPEDGLEGAAAIAQSTPCIHLQAAGLDQTSEVIREELRYFLPTKPSFSTSANTSVLSS